MRERGNMSVELAILTPVLVMLFLLLVVVGRIVDLKSQLDGAARDGARAASIARTDGDAVAFAEQAVADSLGGTSWCKGGPRIVVDAGDWGPGGTVTVTVACDTDLTGLQLVPIGGDVERVGEATAPVDTFRRTECGGGPCEGGAE